MKYLPHALACLVVLACSQLEGPTGPQGPAGPKGDTGPTLEVQVKTGTILSGNYTEANSSFVSIPLASSGTEPTVLFLGIQNENGVYDAHPMEDMGVIWGGTEARFTVPGTRGWYALFPDRLKSLTNANYQVKFVQ